jgi:ABC-type dipeptide/oligopeptide/nickel transport system permease component
VLTLSGPSHLIAGPLRRALLPATLAAIILGIQARRQIQRTGERGAALATTGLALAALWIALTLIVLFALR